MRVPHLLMPVLGYVVIAAVLVGWVVFFTDRERFAWELAGASLGGLIVGDIGFGWWRRRGRRQRASGA